MRRSEITRQITRKRDILLVSQLISAPSYSAIARQITRTSAPACAPMAATGGAAKGPPRKKRVQGPYMDSVEQLALLRTGIAVSISPMETTTDVLEKNCQHG